MARFFVAIEGIDATGKTSVIPRVLTRLREQGIKCAQKPEFPDGALAHEVSDALTRGLFLAEQLPMGPAAAFFYLAYTQAVAVLALPDVDVLVADRYLHSLALYQPYFVPSFDIDSDSPMVLAHLEQLFAALRLPLPDLTILLDAPIEAIVRRLREREKQEVSVRDVAVLGDLQRGYRALARCGGLANTVDAGRPLDETADEIVHLIVQAFRRS